MILSGFTWRLKKSFQLIIVRWRVDHNSYCFSFLHLWWLMAYCSNEASREDHRGSDGRRCVLGRLVFQHHDYMLKDMVKKREGCPPTSPVSQSVPIATSEWTKHIINPVYETSRFTLTSLISQSKARHLQQMWSGPNILSIWSMKHHRFTLSQNFKLLFLRIYRRATLFFKILDRQ